MKWVHKFRVAAVMTLLLLPGMAQAQDTAAPVIDPEAMAALRKMSDYLRTLNAFQVSGEITTEAVLEDSQKIQLSKNVDVVASRPNKLLARIRADQFERVLYYDGSNFTLFAPRMNHYATEPAPANIGEFATLLEDKHGIELPLVDLFRWGTPESDLNKITAAKEVGESVCGGVTCQHYAFRQPGLDWQIWIQRGDHPLPRKIVLTTLTDEARPQHTVVYNWNLAPSFNQEAFAFVAPQGAKRITLADVRAKPTASSANGNGNKK
jgi:hypothetical protein